MAIWDDMGLGLEATQKLLEKLENSLQGSTESFTAHQAAAVSETTGLGETSTQVSTALAGVTGAGSEGTTRVRGGVEEAATSLRELATRSESQLESVTELHGTIVASRETLTSGCAASTEFEGKKGTPAWKLVDTSIRLQLPEKVLRPLVLLDSWAGSSQSKTVIATVPPRAPEVFSFKASSGGDALVLRVRVPDAGSTACFARTRPPGPVYHPLPDEDGAFHCELPVAYGEHHFTYWTGWDSSPQVQSRHVSLPVTVPSTAPLASTEETTTAHGYLETRVWVPPGHGLVTLVDGRRIDPKDPAVRLGPLEDGGCSVRLPLAADGVQIRFHAERAGFLGPPLEMGEQRPAQLGPPELIRPVWIADGLANESSLADVELAARMAPPEDAVLTVNEQRIDWRSRHLGEYEARVTLDPQKLTGVVETANERLKSLGDALQQARAERDRTKAALTDANSRLQSALASASEAARRLAQCEARLRSADQSRQLAQCQALLRNAEAAREKCAGELRATQAARDRYLAALRAAEAARDKYLATLLACQRSGGKKPPPKPSDDVGPPTKGGWTPPPPSLPTTWDHRGQAGGRPSLHGPLAAARRRRAGGLCRPPSLPPAYGALRYHPSNRSHHGRPAPAESEASSSEVLSSIGQVPELRHDRL